MGLYAVSVMEIHAKKPTNKKKMLHFSFGQRLAGLKIVLSVLSNAEKGSCDVL